MTSEPLYQAIARAVDARDRCDLEQNHPWSPIWRERIEKMLACLPSGSGWDHGTKLAKSTPERLVFYGSFHHMNDAGMYDGWTDHEIIVTPSLTYRYNIRVTGRDRNGIKEYLGDLFSDALAGAAPEFPVTR